MGAATSAAGPAEPIVRSRNRVRPEDFVWVMLFLALAIFGPERTQIAIFLLLVLAGFQVAEPRLAVFASPRGAVASILLKLGLCWALIFYTGEIASSYYLTLFLPVISAATTVGLAGTSVISLLACGAYLSFLVFVDWSHQYIPPDQIAELVLRALFFPVVGYLTEQLAEANRVEARRCQAVAEQLATANRHLQEAEAAVRRSERLAALGQLSAGLAHELRNPLGTIKTSAELLTRKVGDENAVAREMAGFISTEVDRTNSLITRFLDFARPLRLRLDETDLAAVLDRAVAQFERHTPPFDVSVYKNYQPDIGPFPLDGELIERVVYNLLVNAAQASPPKGAITVKTRQLNDDVEIAVIDRGAGINPAHLENIFNPFFTTKPDGVGLGLAIVQKIVDEHGGKLGVESEPNEGSVFHVVLPMKRAATADA